MTASPRSRKNWRDATAAMVHPRSITMLFLGFSAGLPILLIFSTLSVWLREAGVERSTVTFFSWAALGYAFKFVWAPLIDRMPVPYLTRRMGRRRSWLLLSQLSLAGAMLWTSAFDPRTALTLTAIGAVLIGFSSATQDIVIDAYRIESAEPELQSMLASMYIAGYRVGMIAAGAGSLWLADGWGTAGTYRFSAWADVYRTMAAAMSAGILTTLVIREPAAAGPKGTFESTGDYLRFLAVFGLGVAGFAGGFFLSADAGGAVKTMLVDTAGMMPPLAGFLAELLRFVFSAGLAALAVWAMIALHIVPFCHVQETYIDPVRDFFTRYGTAALLILLLIGTYRTADILMGVIANVFYVDMGFTKSQIATYTKFWGLWATIGGGFFGGVLTVRYGVIRILFAGAVLTAATNVLFAYLAGQGPDERLLLAVIVADNASAGLAAAAFVAYLSGLTSISFTAMQYALFSSLMTLFPKILAGYSGSMVDSIGYAPFFILTALCGVPVCGLVWWAGRRTPS